MGEKAREAMEAGAEKEAHLVPAPTNLHAFKAKKVTDPGVDFLYFQ